MKFVRNVGSLCLYHSACAFERHRHSGQIPCTLSGAFEARGHPCTRIGGSYSSVTSSSSIRCEVGVIRFLCDENHRSMRKLIVMSDATASRT